MNTPKKHTETMKAKVLELYKKGTPQKEIATLVHIGINTVTRWLKPYKQEQKTKANISQMLLSKIVEKLQDPKATPTEIQQWYNVITLHKKTQNV